MNYIYIAIFSAPYRDLLNPVQCASLNMKRSNGNHGGKNATFSIQVFFSQHCLLLAKFSNRYSCFMLSIMKTI